MYQIIALFCMHCFKMHHVRSTFGHDAVWEEVIQEHSYQNT